MGRGGSVSPFTIAKEMLTNGRGIKQFYKGLDSALIRQITYTTSRMGIYGSLIDNH
jgi:solute carrier family 25 oxoglutarate transporter 11